MSTLPERDLIGAAYITARSSVAFPFPHDVDVAPQLLVLTLLQATLAAAHRALDSAHPVLALTSAPGENPALSDSEHLAILVLEAGNQLATLLSEYAVTVVRETLDDDNLPF